MVYIEVGIATIASFVFGWIWYGPLFGKEWAKENKLKPSKKPEPKKLFYHLLTTILLVFFFSMLLQGSMIDMIRIAFIAWIGFFVSTKLGSMIWMKQSWKLFWIDIVYHLINLNLIAIVIAQF